MKTSRRNFLRLAPASVGAVALGAVALPEKRRPGSFWMTQAKWDGFFHSVRTMSETVLAANQKAVDPPLMYVSEGKVKMREISLE